MSDRPFWLTEEGRVTLALTYADVHAIDDLEDLIRCIDIDIQQRHDAFEKLKARRKISIADVKSYHAGVDKLKLLRSIAMIRIRKERGE